MNQPWAYTCSPSWTLLPLPSPYHPSGSSQCTSAEHPVSCIKSGLAIHFTYDIIRISVPFSQIIPSSPSPTESKRLFYASVSLLFTHLSQVHWFCPLPSAHCICSYPVWVVFFVWVFFLIILFGSNFLVVIFNSFYFISEISLFFQLFQDAFKMFIEWVFLQLL